MDMNDYKKNHYFNKYYYLLISTVLNYKYLKHLFLDPVVTDNFNCKYQTLKFCM